ncbi:MAG: type II toxin-antitoxin system RelE/ParE family toxin, partial [Deltaproteobacteria bacterium]|nr:type II toxin-antitoxin system RelE/ParE family toxin [Deltaproteobacteria bacterium]
MNRYVVRWEKRTAIPLLEAIKDKRVQRLLIKRAERLAITPELQGKPLSRDLAGLWSVRAVGQRYRLVYEIEQESQVVWIVAVGLRRSGDRSDIYEITKKMT